MISQYKEFWIGIIILTCLILILRKPFFGYLIFVLLMFVRPQDDRPLLASYHLPQLIIVLTTLSFVFHEVIIRKKPVWRKSRTLLLFILFFIWMLVSSILSSIPDVTWQAVQEFLFIVLLFYLTIQLVDSEKKIKILFALILFCGLHFAYMLQFHGSTFMESISGQSFSRLNFVRYNINFGQPNYLGFTMNVMFFLSLAMALYVKNKFLKIPFFCFCPIFLYTLMQTASRGASVAFVITLIFFWFFSKNKITYFVVLAMLILFALPIAKETFPNYFNRISTIKTFEEDASATDRLALWQIGFEFIKQKPLFGIGWGEFGHMAFNDAHNSYIQVASEIGITGFIIWIIFLLSGWNEISSVKKKARTNKFIFFSIFAIQLGTIAYVTQSFTAGIAHRELLYFIIAIGISVKFIYYNQKQNNKSTEV